MAQSAQQPPHNLDAEEHVIGAMLISANAVEAASEILVYDDFYRESHGKVFQAALDLYFAGEKVDVLSVCHRLEQHRQLADIGGKERVQEIATLVAVVSNVGHHARIVRETAELRGLLTVGLALQEFAHSRPGETKSLVDRAEQMVFQLGEGRRSSEVSHIAPLVKAGFDRVERLYREGSEITGIPTGFVDLDELTSGLQPGNLVVVAGRTSMGKSAFALSIASHLTIRARVPVLLFTLEMSEGEIVDRLMALEGRVELTRIRNGKVAHEDWERLVGSCSEISQAPLWVDDNAMITMPELRSKARRMCSREGVGLVIVDYLQLMSGHDDIYVRVTENSRALKLLARDLNVPVLALAQLNRGLESRSDKRPMLSDLRDSGAIEQDADLVLFLYRDEVYNPDTDDKGKAEVILAKNRNGPIGKEYLAFIKRFAKFANIAREGQ